MCGRTACTLDKDNINKACGYTTKGKNITFPTWTNVNSFQYAPSYNIAPGSYTPILTNEGVLQRSCSDESQRSLCLMRWGFIPSWYKGLVKDFELKTNNCRAENILQKPTFRESLKNRRRCVVLADGFYEWKTEKSAKKQPYFVYFPQPEGIDMVNRPWKEETFSESEEWMGPRLLTMAGLFDICDTQDERLYSYSVITVNSSSSFSWLHHRMPAILDGGEAIEMWLDQDLDNKEVVELLKPNDNLQWHSVSTVVNNSRNNSVDCIIPLKEEKVKKEVKNTFLTQWLKKESSPNIKTKSEIKDEPEIKRQKKNME